MARYVDIDDIVKTFEKLHGNESTLIICRECEDKLFRKKVDAE